MEAVLKLEKILAENSIRLKQLSVQDVSKKASPSKWSKKEILGHLTDSAFNNHQRFVRMQIDNNIELLQYKQNDWVAIQRYQDLEWNIIVELWRTTNQHIVHLLKRVDHTKLSNTAKFPEFGVLSLQFIIEDYVEHLAHHFKAIFQE